MSRKNTDVDKVSTMRKITRCLASLLILLFSTGAIALNEVRVETRTDDALIDFAVTGKGVTIAVLDRGISWQHPDFIKPDGTAESSKCWT